MAPASRVSLSSCSTGRSWVPRWSRWATSPGTLARSEIPPAVSERVPVERGHPRLRDPFSRGVPAGPRSGWATRRVLRGAADRCGRGAARRAVRGAGRSPLPPASGSARTRRSRRRRRRRRGRRVSRHLPGAHRMGPVPAPAALRGGGRAGRAVPCREVSAGCSARAAGRATGSARVPPVGRRGRPGRPAGRKPARVPAAAQPAPEAKLAIEYDGAVHFTRRLRERDLQRDAILASHGWLTLRFGRDDVGMAQTSRRVRSIRAQRARAA